MKKGNISVDFVLFGDLGDDDTQKKLQTFNDAVKGSEGSHLVVVPPSSKLLSDQLVATPILMGEGAAGSSGGGMGDGNEEFEFGFDPAMEPELALALRMSMEEEKARQEKRAKEEEEAARKASLGDIKEEDEAGPASGSGANGDKKDDDKMYTS
jgi:26S proteasome regulatory subunit N10